MKNIRVAMLRADCHAYTFAPLMAKVDEAVFEKNFFAEYFFMVEVYAHKLRTPVVPGFEIVKLWDKDDKAAQGVADMLFGKPKVCSQIEDLTEGIDAAFINDGNLDGSDHLELTAPFLKKGIPTFVDKPFASTLKDAVAMVDLAIKHDAPLMATSIMSYVNELQYMKSRYAELTSEPLRGVVNGVGGNTGLGGMIHGLSLGHAVFGEGVEWVECMGEGPLQYLLMHYTDGKEMLVINAPPTTWDLFICDVYSRRTGIPLERAHLRSNTMDDPEFVKGALNIVHAFREMVQTRKPPMPYSRLVELIAIVEAGRLAQRNRQRVHLKDVPGWTDCIERLSGGRK